MTFQTLQMKQYVQFFGANVTNDVLRGATTHLITKSLTSEKSILAQRSDCKVTTIEWLMKSMEHKGFLKKRMSNKNAPYENRWTSTVSLRKDMNINGFLKTINGNQRCP